MARTIPHPGERIAYQLDSWAILRVELDAGLVFCRRQRDGYEAQVHLRHLAWWESEGCWRYVPPGP